MTLTRVEVVCALCLSSTGYDIQLGSTDVPIFLAEYYGRCIQFIKDAELA